jgi:hypothetical protein
VDETAHSLNTDSMQGSAMAAKTAWRIDGRLFGMSSIDRRAQDRL